MQSGAEHALINSSSDGHPQENLYSFLRHIGFAFDIVVWYRPVRLALIEMDLSLWKGCWSDDDHCSFLSRSIGAFIPLFSLRCAVFPLDKGEENALAVSNGGFHILFVSTSDFEGDERNHSLLPVPLLNQTYQ